MNKDKIIEEYKERIKVKKKEVYSRSEERVKDFQDFYKGVATPKDVFLFKFFKWARECDEIEAVVLFGSYCKGINTSKSFNRHKHAGKEKLLSYGPSDLDALIIGSSNLQLPSYLAEYKIYNQLFEIVGIEQLDLFRDLITFPSKGAKNILAKHNPEYVAGYLYSYFDHGIILKTNKRINQLFKDLREENPDYKERASKYFLGKIKWFEDFLK